ncbi:MAG: GntR family transcriptional regulator [Streptosporangiaceae bacterium]
MPDPAAGTAGQGQYVSKNDLVTDELRELITDRQFSPGTPLRQRELAEQFDVSYTPTRAGSAPAASISAFYRPVRGAVRSCGACGLRERRTSTSQGAHVRPDVT